MGVCPECGLKVDGSTTCPVDRTPLVDPGSDALLGTHIGSFRVARLLGEGGMGQVYLGVHPGIGSRVAIKILSHECTRQRDLVQRFFAEAKAVNVVRNEGIVNVLDLAALEDGRPYIIMEYLDGVSLGALFARTGPMPLGTLGNFMLEVLRAIGAAHDAGIVHRDLKPDNIFVTAGGRAKVLDFGIAKLHEDLLERSAATRTGSVLGTPHYMAPEQAMGRKIDARADLYALGVILYEGATGQKPIPGDSIYALIRNHVEYVPAPPQSLRVDLPDAYDEVIMRALAKDPGARFGSVGEFGAALEAAMGTLDRRAWSSVSGTGSASAPTPGPSTPPDSWRGVAPSLPPPSVPSMPPARRPDIEFGAETETKPGRSRTAAVIVSFITLAALGAFAVAWWQRRDRADDADVSIARVDPPSHHGPADPDSPVGHDRLASHEAPSEGGAAPEVHGRQGGADSRASETARRIAPAEPGAATTPPKESKSTRTRPESPSSRREHPEVEAPPAADPPEETTSSKFAAFDVTGFLPKAQKVAQKHHRDAELVKIIAEGVRPDGRADLTLKSGLRVTYRFRSSEAAKQPSTVPVGMPSRVECAVVVVVSEDGVSSYTTTSPEKDCGMAVRTPRCSARGVWKNAIAAGAPSGNAVGELIYAAKTRAGSPEWRFEVPSAFNSRWLPDDC